MTFAGARFIAGLAAHVLVCASFLSVGALPYPALAVDFETAADKAGPKSISDKSSFDKKGLALSAVVIRYDNFSQKLSADQWRQILDEISQLKIETIIIQYHHFVPRKTTEAPSLPEIDFMPPRAPVIAAPAAKPLSKTEAAETKVGEVHSAESKYVEPHSIPGRLTSKKKTLTKVSVGDGGNKPDTKKVEVKVQADVLRATPAEPYLDATALILDYADAHKMKVFLGLWMDINWFANLDVMDQLAHNLSVSKDDIVKLQEELKKRKSAADLTAVEIKDSEAAIAVCKRGITAIQEELDEKSLYFAASKDGQLAGPTIKLASSLDKLYGQHQSFVGWYLPEEIWDAAFCPETISILNPLLKFITDNCRQVSKDKGRLFVMSPHASRLHYDSVDEIVASHTALLKNSGVDILMLQDSVGDLNLKDDDDIAVRLKKHFTAFKKVCRALNMQLWAELESFAQTNQTMTAEAWLDRKPTNITRFKKQFQYTYPYLDAQKPVYAVFDYLHFFSLLDAKYPDARERAKLYDEYKRDFVDSDFVPPPTEAQPGQ